MLYPVFPIKLYLSNVNQPGIWGLINFHFPNQIYTMHNTLWVHFGRQAGRNGRKGKTKQYLKEQKEYSNLETGQLKDYLVRKKG